MTQPSDRPPKIPLFAVIRYETDATALEFRVTVKEVLPTREEAEAEVRRLNEISRSPATVYFWQPTRYYPEGRKVRD